MEHRTREAMLHHVIGKYIALGVLLTAPISLSHAAEPVPRSAEIRVPELAATKAGTAKAPSGKVYDVKWDRSSKDVYVSYAGWSFCGKADTVTVALLKAERFLAKQGA